MDGDYQNNIDSLPKLSEYRYENLFRVYNIDNYKIYNIINSLKMDKDISPEYYYNWVVNKRLPWTVISYVHYETIKLWWLICLTNNVMNPIPFPENGSILKIIKPVYVREIIDQISKNINE